MSARDENLLLLSSFFLLLLYSSPSSPYSLLASSPSRSSTMGFGSLSSSVANLRRPVLTRTCNNLCYSPSILVQGGLQLQHPSLLHLSTNSRSQALWRMLASSHIKVVPALQGEEDGEPAHLSQQPPSPSDLSYLSRPSTSSTPASLSRMLLK